jgi:nicotinamide-nucleotide adenylyltransferase
MNKTDIPNIIRQFLKKNDAFKVIYQPSTKLLTPISRRLLILDSSFNPPHLGHFSMIKQSILLLCKDNKDLNISTINTNSVLLLFSVKNADKDSVTENEYIKRLNMVNKMCEIVSNELGISCGIALTNASLFVDKNELIRKWVNNYNNNYNNNNNNNNNNSQSNEFNIDTYFLLGFDTLIRFLDKKYYNDTIFNSLKSFFETSKIIVFLRDDPSSKFDVHEQEKYVEDLDINQDWKNRIKFCESKEEWSISSSKIRKLIAEKDVTWKKLVIPGIEDDIIS